MKKKRLRQGVSIPVFGQDYRGLQSEVWFTETPQEGWYWRPYKYGPILPINISLARYYVFGFIYLRHWRSSLAVWEHIAALMYTGLTGVIVEGSSHPPYHGRVRELWDTVRPHLIETGEEVEWCRPVREVEWRYPKRNGFTRIVPHDDKIKRTLDVTIHIDYPGIGSVTKDFSFPSEWSTLEDAFSVYAQGFPRWKRPVALLLSEFGWPHACSLTWPHEQSREETTDLFLRHRLVDLLGGLSLASHNRLLAGRVISVRSGHLADLNALSMTGFTPI